MLKNNGINAARKITPTMLSPGKLFCIQTGQFMKANFNRCKNIVAHAEFLVKILNF